MEVDNGTNRTTRENAFMTRLFQIKNEMTNNTLWDSNKMVADVQLVKAQDTEDIVTFESIPMSQSQEKHQYQNIDDLLGNLALEDQTSNSDDDKLDIEDSLIEEHKQPSIVKNTSESLSVNHKLRPSTQIFNQILWDPELDPTKFTIGYLDRFKGVKEMPFLNFRKDLSDISFIPFHRVMWFKREGVLVWDREKRIDMV